LPTPNTGFVGVSAGELHSLGLKADGSVVGWGHNNNGQCDVPPPNTGFVAISGGAYHSLGLRADGSVVAWGWDEHGESSPPAWNVVCLAIAAGKDRSLTVKVRVRGDLNCDDVVSFDDMGPFVLALTDPVGYAALYPDCPILNADCDADGDVDLDDINAFVGLLTR